MENFKILTPGEKIKEIRTRFKMRQSDLTGDSITRNLISIIENNKANLTASVAKILASNINTICKEKNIDFLITADYLLESPSYQCKKFAKQYIDYIRNLSLSEIDILHSKLNEIEIFLKTFDVEEFKPKLYIEIARKLKLNKQYTQAIKYYLKAYENSNNLQVTSYSLNMLGSCSMYLSNYNNAIDFYNTLINLDSDPQTQFITKFNIALCYKKLCKYEKALKILYEISDNYYYLIINKPESYIELNSVIGICLNEINSFNKSINTFNKLLKFVKDDFKREEIIILLNLCDVYRNIKDYYNLENLCSITKNKIHSNLECLKEYESAVYISLAKNLIALNHMKESTDLLHKALESFKKGTSLMYLEDIETFFMTFLDIYMKKDDEDNISYLRNQMIYFIENNFLPKYNMVALKFLQYYNNKANRNDMNNFLSFLSA